MPNRSVTTRYVDTSIAVNVNTGPLVPARSVVDLGAVILDEVTVVIPRGHAGLTGVAVELAGTRILPFREGGWIIGDGSEMSYVVGIEVGAGLAVVAYNQGSTVHSFHLRWRVTDITTGDGFGPAAVVAL